MRCADIAFARKHASAIPAAGLKNLAFERIEWAPLAALPGYDFLAADRELVAQLASGALRVAEPNGDAMANTSKSIVSECNFC